MSFPIQTSCPRCGAGFVVPQEKLGTIVTCPDCLEEMLVEKPASTKASPSGPPYSAEEALDWPSSQAQADDTSELDDRQTSVNTPVDTHREPSPESAYDFSAVCPLCGTRQDTTSEQIGSTLKCPDCHYSFKVMEPPRSARRKPLEKPLANDGELQLSDAVQSTIRTKLSQDWIGEAENELAKQTALGRGSITPQHVARETLRKATDEFGQAAQQEPQLPRHPFRTGLLAFLYNPMILARWVLTAIALEIELSAIAMTIRSAQEGGLAQIFALFMGLFACVFGLFLFCFISTSLLLVTQNSSQGRDEITGWPGINVTEWMFEAWPMIAVLFLTYAPGVLLGQLLAAIAGNATWVAWIGVGVGVASMTLLFPILMLSWMENSAPYSKPIWRSVLVCQPVWLSFWLHSGSLVLVLGVLVRLRLRWGGGFGSLILDAAILLGLLVYFRLLGRLSWTCDEALSRLEQDQAMGRREQSQAGESRPV